MKRILLTCIISSLINQLTAQSVAIDSLLNLLKITRNDSNKMNILYQLSEESQDDNDVLSYAVRSLQLAEKLNNKRGMANAYNNIGYVYNSKGDYNQALEYFRKSLKISTDINDQTGIANTLENVGVIFYVKGDFASALDNYNKSLKLYEAAGNFGNSIKN